VSWSTPKSGPQRLAACCTSWFQCDNSSPPYKSEHQNSVRTAAELRRRPARLALQLVVLTATARTASRPVHGNGAKSRRRVLAERPFFLNSARTDSSAGGAACNSDHPFRVRGGAGGWRAYELRKQPRGCYRRGGIQTGRILKGAKTGPEAAG